MSDCLQLRHKLNNQRTSINDFLKIQLNLTRTLRKFASNTKQTEVISLSSKEAERWSNWANQIKGFNLVINPNLLT